MQRLLASSIMAARPRWLPVADSLLRPCRSRSPLPTMIFNRSWFKSKPRKVSRGISMVSRKVNKQGDLFNEGMLSHILWWKEKMESCRKPSSVQLTQRLVYSNILGLDSTLRNGSLKDGTLNMEMLQFKSKFPREVLLCRVGEFYEAIGFDACILVEHAGLNPFGGLRSDSIPKAGCPIMLMLMKRGGELIYAGPLGHHSCEVVQYFQAILGVPRIKDNYNPSTWMLEVTSTSMEIQLGVDFAQLYKGSSMCKDKDALVKRLSIPALGTSDLHFPTKFTQKFREQFKACLWKQCLSYWRTPSYNLVRMGFITVSCILFGVLFWQQGNINHITDQQGLFTILGCMYGITLFTGINNSQSVVPFVSVERTVMYRERFAGMYSPWAYSFAQVAMEIPYVLVQVVLFMLIVYPMIGYTWTAAKFFWFMYTMLCTLLYFLYFGMMLVSLTPNIQVASILASMFYTLQNLMSGFVVPAPQIPRWWIWLYYISPMSWTLNVFFTSQFGDADDRMIIVFGETKSVAAFMRDYFGFHYDLLPLAAVILAAFPVIFALLFGYNISKLNFQRR